MDSKEPKIEEAPISLQSGLVEAQQVTSIDKNKTKQKNRKNQGVLQLAKKKLVEHNRRVREEKMKGGSKQFEDPKDPGTTGASYGARTIIITLTYSNSFTRWLDCSINRE